MITRSKSCQNKRPILEEEEEIETNSSENSLSSNQTKRLCTDYSGNLSSTSSASSSSSSSSLLDQNLKVDLKQETDKNNTKKSESLNSTSSSSTSLDSTLSNCDSKSQNHSDLIELDSLLRPVNFDFRQPLPPEILVLIFQHLLNYETTNRCRTLLKLSQVCEHWRCLIISSPLLWQRLDFVGITPDDRPFPLATLDHLQCQYRLFSNVRELNISHKEYPSLQSIFSIISKYSNVSLEHLNVSQCRYIYNCKFRKLLEHYCRQLKSLDISSVTPSTTRDVNFMVFSSFEFGPVLQRGRIPNFFRALTLRPILKICGSNLTSLKMSNNMIPSFHCVDGLIGKYCQNLEMLDISHTMTTCGHQAWISMKQIQLGCPKLRYLRAVNFCLVSDSCTHLPGFPVLEELFLSYSEDFFGNSPFNRASTNHDQIIISLTKNSTKLSILDIENTIRVTPRCLLQIPSQSMRKLFLGNCTNLEDDSLALVIDKWNKSLVHLDLSGNRSRSCIESCIASLCRDYGGGPKDSSSPPLESIKLNHSAVSFESVKLLLTNCHHLVSLDITGCIVGFPRGLRKTLYTGERFRKLRRDIVILEKYDKQNQFKKWQNNVRSMNGGYNLRNRNNCNVVL